MDTWKFQCKSVAGLPQYVGQSCKSRKYDFVLSWSGLSMPKITISMIDKLHGAKIEFSTVTCNPTEPNVINVLCMVLIRIWEWRVQSFSLTVEKIMRKNVVRWSWFWKVSCLPSFLPIDPGVATSFCRHVRFCYSPILDKGGALMMKITVSQNDLIGQTKSWEFCEDYFIPRFSWANCFKMKKKNKYICHAVEAIRVCNLILNADFDTWKWQFWIKKQKQKSCVTCVRRTFPTALWDMKFWPQNATCLSNEIRWLFYGLLFKNIFI